MSECHLHDSFLEQTDMAAYDIVNDYMYRRRLWMTWRMFLEDPVYTLFLVVLNFVCLTRGSDEPQWSCNVGDLSSFCLTLHFLLFV